MILYQSVPELIIRRLALQLVSRAARSESHADQPLTRLHQTSSPLDDIFLDRLAALHEHRAWPAQRMWQLSQHLRFFSL